MARRMGVVGTFLVSLATTVTVAAPMPEGRDVRQDDPFEILLRLKASHDAVRSFTARLHKWERIGGTLVFQVADVRFRQPLDVSFEVLEGKDRGLRAVYRQGHHDNEVHVAFAGFWKNFGVGLTGRRWIDPLGGTALGAQHHPITAMGLSNLTDMILRKATESRTRGEGSVRLAGTELLDGRETYLVSLTSPEEIDGQHHTVQPGDTLWTIAERFGQDPSVILHHNPTLDRAGDLPEGRDVFIPRYYAYQTHLWIDVSTDLLLQVQAYDWQGELYESYRYETLRTNVELPDELFAFE